MFCSFQHIILEESDKFKVVKQKKTLEKQYSFDMVFGEDSSQEEVYEFTAKSLVPDVLNG